MNISKFNSPIAENILTIIENKGIKKYAVADKAGFKRQEFSDMLQGRKVIKACDIPIIAVALEMSPNDLYFPQSTSHK